MATGTSIISGGLRICGQLRGAGHGASASELAEGLVSLNGLFGEWSADGVGLYQIVRETCSLSGAASYTIGATGSINSTRPLRFLSAEVLASSGARQAVRICSAEEWSQILDDSRTGDLADLLYVDYGFPLTTMRIWPKPGSGTLIVNTLKPLSEVAAVGDTVTLPPGYEEALEYGLALKLAPRYQRTLGPEVVAMAERSRAAIARTNAQLMPAGNGGGAQ
jgi:hypothetical protein